MGRKHNVDEVIRQLERKNCYITGAEAITKKIKEIVLPNEHKIQEGYNEYLKNLNRKKVDAAVKKHGVDKANEFYFRNFRSANEGLFKPKEVLKTIVIQPAFTINIQAADVLGNKSWGKIDFLINYHGYTLMR